MKRLPPAARLVMISRVDPGLGLARLRGRGDLLELRARELTFTLAEARELVVERGGIQLGPDEVELLCERTEGWPAALALACIWLRSADDAPSAVREFGGSHGFVVDYLTDEVLASLDDDVRSFLLSVSVLGRFTPELCDGVLGRTDSAAMLARLERSNLFVTRLERGGWFRVHPLFAEFAGITTRIRAAWRQSGDPCPRLGMAPVAEPSGGGDGACDGGRRRRGRRPAPGRESPLPDQSGTAPGRCSAGCARCPTRSSSSIP